MQRNWSQGHTNWFAREPHELERSFVVPHFRGDAGFGHGVVCAPLVVFGQQKNAELLVALVGGHAHGNLIGDLFDDFRGDF